MGRRQTDEISVFDMGQLLLFAEGIERHELQVGRAEARRRAFAEMHMVFDSPTLQAAVQRNDELLPSYLAQELSWVARRRDWPSRRQGFVREERDAHLAEAWRRCSGLPAKLAGSSSLERSDSAVLFRGAHVVIPLGDD
jgi:hypothetical protein